MNKTKYITSGGLAFSEGKEMEKLRRFSLKGWLVSGFKFMGYTLEKGERTDYIDYRSLKEDEKEEYVEFFSSSGWTHVALPQKGIFIYFEHILVQNRFIRTVIQRLKSINIQVIL